MNKNTLRKRLANTKRKKNTLKRSRRLNASRRLKKRTSKKQSGGAWYKYQGVEKEPGDYDMNSLKQNKVSTFGLTDKYSARKNIWREEYGNWEDFLKENEQKYEEYESKISSRPVPLEGESLTQWAYLKNMDAVAKELPFFSEIEKPYLNRIVFHKYYGEGKVIDYEGGFNGKGWFIQFISPTFGGDGISKVDQNFIEEFADNSDSSKESSSGLSSKSPRRGSPSKSPRRGSPSKSPRRESPSKSPRRGSPSKSPRRGSPSKSPRKEDSVTGGDQNTKYVYTFMFSKSGLSGGNILVKREIQDTIGESTANYLRLEGKNPELGEKLVKNISEHPPSFNTMIRKLKLDENIFNSRKEIYSSDPIMMKIIGLTENLLEKAKNIIHYAYTEEVTDNNYPELTKYLIFTKKLKELKEREDYTEYIRLYSHTFFPDSSSNTGTGDTKISGGAIGYGRLARFLMALLALITIILALAVLAGGGPVTGILTLFIAKAHISAGVGNAILAAIPKIMTWGTTYLKWMGAIAVMGTAVKKPVNSFIVSKLYDRYINNFTFKSGKKKEGRKILNSIRSDIIKAGLEEKSFRELTKKWFSGQLVGLLSRAQIVGMFG